MGTVKKVKKAEAGAVCGPGFGKRKGSCTPSGRSMGAFGRSNRTMKTEGYKPGRPIKFGKDKDNEPVISGRKPKEIGVWHKEWDSDESIPKNLKSGYKEKMKNGGKKVVKKAKMGKKVIKQSKKK